MMDLGGFEANRSATITLLAKWGSLARNVLAAAAARVAASLPWLADSSMATVRGSHEAASYEGPQQRSCMYCTRTSFLYELYNLYRYIVQACTSLVQACTSHTNF